MKKTVLTLGFILLGMGLGFAQSNEKTPPQYPDDFSKQFEQMQKQLSLQLQKMFDTEGVDSPDSTDGKFGFNFNRLPFGSMDSSFTKSFGYSFDGKDWKSFGSEADSSKQGMPGGMPNFGRGFGMDMGEMMKQMEQLFGSGLKTMPFDGDGLPRVKPKHPKGEESKNSRKYKTEKL